MAYQGRGPMSELDLFEIPSHYSPSFELDDPIGGEHMNLMKAALVHSHRIVAVSHGYAWECQTQEGGWGLDSILREQSWKLCGILNGIDQSLWSPDRDPHLQSDDYSNYSMDSLDRKTTCKAALQRQMGLKVDPEVPLLGFIGRLDYQKGVDLIRDSYEWLMEQEIQLVLLGSGRPDLESALHEMEDRNPDHCRAWVGFSSEMAHRITAGCDILLMPSRFEPCGLNQLYAMKYGTVPVVHAVGGLRDTVIPFDPFEDSGTGWTFDWMEKSCFQQAMYNAIKTFREFPDSFRLLQQRGMAQNFGWENSALQYNEVLKAAKYQW